MDKLKDYILNKTEEVNINMVDSVAPTGGGGDSDFSTAEVTLAAADPESFDEYYWNDDTESPIPIPYINDDEIVTPIVAPLENQKVLVPLYKGKHLITSKNSDEVIINIVGGSGNVTFDYYNDEEPWHGVVSAEITGNCTLYIGYVK